MSGFWKHYEKAKPHVAAAVDDVRHNLVEEAWYGRRTTGDIAPKEPDNTGIKVSSIDNSTNTTTNNVLDQSTTTNTTNNYHRHHDLYESVWGTEAKTTDIYGNAPLATQGPTVEPAASARQQREGLEPGY